MATRSSQAGISRDDSLPAAPTHAGNDSHSAGADQDVSRKFQRAPSENDNPLQNMIVSGSTSTNNASRLPTSTSEPFIAPATGSNPRFSFGKLPSRATDTTSSYDFLPSVNFDDFHESLSGPELSDFPVPGGGRGMFTHDESDNDTMNSVATAPPERKPASRAPSTSSFSRRPSLSQRRQPSRSDLSDASAAQSAAPLSVRTRRQSQFSGPAPVPDTSSFSSGNTAVRGPRKSIGPGLLSSGRAAGNGRSPTKGLGPAPAQKTGTPSAANKRQSLHHAGGLGARTISPTDARRLKRLSMGPNVPAASPRNPPTPQPDTQQEPLPTSYSPALAFRKSITPSSARATPDNNSGKSIPAPALSNSSSFSSLRGSSQIPTRSSQIFSSSRLPTPKPRNVHSSAGPENPEEVPPVPAIPKAFESPRTEIDQPLYPTRQTPATPATPATEEPNWTTSVVESTDSDNNKKTAAVESKTIETGTNETKKAKTTGRHRRGLTVGADSDADKGGHQAASNRGNKGLAPLRLPPLNLLPLSTPTAAKIASYPHPSGELDERGPTTPPPKRNYTKTPSTPLTASKATFGFHDEDMPTEMRSNTSHYHLRSTLETPSFPPPPAEPMPIPAPTGGERNSNTTPFSSNSLPKNDGEFGHLSSKVKDDFCHMERPYQYSYSKPFYQQNSANAAHCTEKTFWHTVC
ncbi:hypothetical protein GTA08_BOTSDO08255 [Neofusicoccum parvum]|nr:hypothetical protein GTA08_BOTSDO08255 [Neofusicoccum parvum]